MYSMYLQVVSHVAEQPLDQNPEYAPEAKARVGYHPN